MQVLFPLLALALLFFAPAWLSFLVGIAVGLFSANPFIHITKKWTPKLLSLAIIGLGAGMDLNVLYQVGVKGIGYTVVGIGTTLLVGFLLSKSLKTEKNISLLLSMGTAICGASAIAATAPVIEAKDDEISISLGIVFLLNAIALLVFPIIGHNLALSENQFGLWAALSIHDTSSVVGATMGYGPLALKLGTTIKLARAIWIIPIVTLISFSRRNKGAKVKKPWFILGFILAAAIVTTFPSLQPLGETFALIAKRIFVLALFFIGSHLSKEAISKVGVKTFLFGLILWLITGSLTLLAIYNVIIT